VCTYLHIPVMIADKKEMLQKKGAELMKEARQKGALFKQKLLSSKETVSLVRVADLSVSMIQLSAVK
jgi:hypothetical protein